MRSDNAEEDVPATFRNGVFLIIALETGASNGFLIGSVLFK